MMSNMVVEEVIVYIVYIISTDIQDWKKIIYVPAVKTFVIVLGVILSKIFLKFKKQQIN